MKRVILCRPEGPRNVGMIVRVCQNFGPCELALVRPAKPSMLVHPEFTQMSHGADDLRENLEVFDTLGEALADCTFSVGFSARVRGNRVRQDWRDLQDAVHPRVQDEAQRVALVFGNEVTGMTREETDLMIELAHIRTSKDHTSLNLAMTVGVVLSSLYAGREVHQPEPGGSMLNGEGREFLKQRLKEVFGGQVALTPSASEDICASIDRVFSRAPLENRDARAWHLMLRALGSSMTPGELGLEPNRKAGRRKDALERREQRKHAADGE